MGAAEVTRERALEKSLLRMLRVARAAVVAQQKVDYWQQFGNRSKRRDIAEARYEKAIIALEAAEADAHEALHFVL